MQTESLKSRKRVPLYIALSLSVVLTFVLSEGLIRIAFSRYMNYGYEMWRYAALMKQGVLDARGHVHIPGRSAHLMGVDVRINSEGLRDREFPLKKDPSRVRIFAIGDSFTLGWGVREEETFPKLIEASLSHTEGTPKMITEVINGGVGNYNTEQELTAYQIDYSRYDPDWVLLCFYINDAEPAQEHLDSGWESMVLKHSALFSLLSGEVSELKTVFDPEFRYENYYRSQFEGESWEKYRKVIHEFSQTVHAKGLKPGHWMVALLPDLRNLENYPFVAVQKKVADEFSQEGALTVDLRPAFTERPSSIYWVSHDDPHPNARANQVIAQVLSDAIKKKTGE